MIEAVGTIIASSGFGSVVGGVFGWLNRKEDRKDRQDERNHERAMVGLQSDADVQTANSRAFEESQKTKSAFGDAIKSAVRPLITAALLYQSYIILVSLEALTGGLRSLSPDLTLALYRDIVLNVISLTATCVSWWFASRPSTVSKR